MIAMLLVMLAGAVSALLYARARRRADAALVACAALALTGLLGDFTVPGGAPTGVAIDPDAALIDISSAASVTVAGDGMRAARWRDLPARALAWQMPQGEVLRLEFPRRLQLGRMFTLTVRRTRNERWRMQLLAENGQLLAESPGHGPVQTLEWMPPLAEPLVLKARLLDAAGKPVTEGPLPLEVRAPLPLRALGRFSAPSFDVRVLAELLGRSHALLDWQVLLGRGISRVETPRAPLGKPELLLLDAAWLELRGAGERAALLAQVEQGATLLVLGANARDRAFWARELQLDLREQADGKAGKALAMTRAPLGPVADGHWSTVDGSLATRHWGAGRIGWLAVADWHRHAISDPRALGLWWQQVLDRAQVRQGEPTAWLDTEPMPVAGERLEVCAQGVSGEVVFPQLRQTLAWQRRADRADAACVAVWPAVPGWLTMHANGGKAVHRIYIYGATQWRAWQAALKRDATAAYAARTPTPAVPKPVPWPAWPFAALFVLAMLALWWRERR